MYTWSLFIYFWTLLFLLCMCFVCVTGTQGPHLCIFGLFSFFICVCFVCVPQVHKVHVGVFLASLV